MADVTGERLRVLIVEDDADLVLIMRHELALAGHDVLIAHSAEHAVSQAPDADLVLLDFHLPGSNGLDVMRQIQKLPAPPSVVMVTGDDLGGLDQEALRAGAIDFVPKRPGYLRALPGIVQRAARQHDLTRRVADLEAVALSLLSAEGRDEAIAEILHGACRMLRARSAALVRITDAEEAPVAQVGGAQALIDSVRAMPAHELPAPGRALPLDPNAVIVRLTEASGQADLLLLAGSLTASSGAREELDLAEAYARVAATALQAARRRRQQAEMLDALRETIAGRHESQDRARRSVVDLLGRVSTELQAALASEGLDTATLRTLSRAEAHLSAAEAAAEDLLDRGDEG